MLLILGASYTRPGAAKAAEEEWVYDANGYAELPRMCPAALPNPNWNPWDFGQTHYVPKSGMDAGDEIRFRVTSWTWTNDIQAVTVGFGWYKPDQDEATDMTGRRWVWRGEAPTRPGGLYFRCEELRWWWGRVAAYWATNTGRIYGYAYPPELNTDPKGSTRPAGGGEGDEVCYEYYEWWYDAWGTYHEDVLDYWCEEYET